MSSDEIRAHYERQWCCKAQEARWDSGPSWQLPRDFTILVFPPTKLRKMWTYATCGMSHQGDAEAIEIHLLSPIRTDSHVELLTAIAHYHLTGSYLNVGHTVNFGRPWLPGSRCEYGLISLPYLDGPTLEWLESSGGKTRFLWLVAITQEEVYFKKIHGLEALESRFEASGSDFLEPLRASVV